MSNVYGAETQVLGGYGGYGGGFGGWGGGYGCGIAPVGLFGLFGGCNNGFNNGCHDKCDHNGHNGHFDTGIILDDNHYNSLQASIGGVKDTVVTVKDNITSLGYNIGDKFNLTNSLIQETKFQGALNTKDIIHDIDIQTCALGSKIDKGLCETNHNIDNKFFALSKQMSDCCCELEKQGLKNTQVILDKLNATEIAELRDRLCRCEKENDFFRFNGAIAANFASFRAATAGSNFNTGTQSSNTSNNSGQQVGAQA